MKLLETHFEEYVSSVNKENLHPKLTKIYNQFPDNINKLNNLIFYGPSGTGKYSQMLYSIKKYSPSELKYEKKISIIFNKETYYLKISDIHFEVDLSILGCNSKLLWHEIYEQIIDIIYSSSSCSLKQKVGIIVCKEFHNINNELLETFYSYIQNNHIHTFPIKIKFIFLTENISFIPDNILSCCQIINISRPTKLMYSKCINRTLTSDIKLQDIINIKNLQLNIHHNDINKQYKKICDKIINELINVNELQFIKFRDFIYELFIYNLDINECIWYIIYDLIEKKYIKKESLSELLLKVCNFFKYYNNNYRPIYHLESILFYLASIIHGF
jgi:DNA polymerase III delta prime subunit